MKTQLGSTSAHQERNEAALDEADEFEVSTRVIVVMMRRDQRRHLHPGVSGATSRRTQCPKDSAHIHAVLLCLLGDFWSVIWINDSCLLCCVIHHKVHPIIGPSLQWRHLHERY